MKSIFNLFTSNEKTKLENDVSELISNAIGAANSEATKAKLIDFGILCLKIMEVSLSKKGINMPDVTSEQRAAFVDSIYVRYEKAKLEAANG